MDWLDGEASFDDNDFGNFKYEPTRFKIIRKLHSDEKLICWDIRSDEDLKEWIELNEPLIDCCCGDGMFAIIFNRCRILQYSSPSYLPVSQHGFNDIIRVFHIHRSIVRTIRREVTYFSRTHLPFVKSSDSSIAYTTRMSSEWPDDIALSSTYLCLKRLSLSVFYGCNKDQSLAIQTRLEEAGDAIYHPMLTPGILVELDRHRVTERVDSILDPFVSSTEALCCPSRDPESILNEDGENIDELFYLYSNTSELAKGIRQVQRQISDMYKHTYELEVLFKVKRRKKKFRKKTGLEKQNRVQGDIYSLLPNMETRIRERLLEIEAEYNAKLDDCQMVLSGLNFSIQLASGHVARHQTFTNTRISIETKRDNAQMRSIALVTMVYLPLTSVASIFSMGVFNWGATGEQPVLTVYFWVYVAIGGGLTVLTIGLWWGITRSGSRSKEHNEATDVVKMA
ncbi:hypothetical protein F5Y11DRAFT_53897 [Daldinia sp. FL1419]|nr:hypothetical protein F5Y11DRAFT_53897 [Daldinia sp. FL1419]